MDVDKALHQLYEEKKRLDQMIHLIEARLRMISSRPTARSRRGRRSMSPEERLKVSQRMSQYWAARRAAKTNISVAAGVGSD
jgi:hypothetical protein